MILITLINYAVITIEEEVIDVAKDFTALVIVAEFDNFFSFNNGVEIPKQITTDKEYKWIFEIETTTSWDAAGDKGV